MFNALGGESSRFSDASFAAAVALAAMLTFAWRQRVLRGDSGGRVRRWLAIAGLWTTSISTASLLMFSAWRSLDRVQVGHHTPAALVIALCGVVVSPIGVLGVFAAESRRWLVALSSLVLTALWFWTALDNVRW